MSSYRKPSSALIMAGVVVALTASLHFASAAAPDLAPAVPAGFSSSIVVSNGANNTQGSNPIFTTDTVFVNFGYTNLGGAMTASPTFNITLQVDGTPRANAIPAQAGIGTNVVVAVKDINIGSLSAGPHSITVVLNPAPTSVVESNTANNSFTTSFTVPAPAPVIISSLNATGTAGQPFQYQIQATNNPTSFNALNLPSGLSVSPSGLISGSPSASGSFGITITATNTGGTDSKTLTLVVGAIPPSITSPLAAHGSLGVAFVYNLTATGAPSPSFTANPLPAGLAFGGTQITGIPLQAGTTFVTLTATNDAGVDTKTLVIDITSPPVINSPLVIGGAVGDSSFSYTITATNGASSFSTTALPPGFNAVNAQTGVINVGASGPTAAGTYTVGFTARNALNGSSDPCTFINTTGIATATATIAISTVKGAPAITSPLAATGIETTPFAYGINATNIDASTVFSATFPPGLTGLAVDSKTGLITGLPGLLPGAFPVPAQTFAVTITATNSKGSGSATLNVTISPAIPVITSDVTDQITVITQKLFQYQITATTFTDPNVGATTFSGNFPIPSSNISVDPNTGLMSGTPVDGVPPVGDVGNYTVTITARNSRGSDTKIFTAVVASALPASTPTAPVAIVFTGPYNAVAVAGCPFTFPVTATGAQCYTVAQGTTIPPHLVLDQFGVISGTPQAADAKALPYTFTIGASILAPGSDPSLPPVCVTPDKAEATFTLTILSAPPTPAPPVITSPVSNSLTVGTPLAYTITTTPTIASPTTPLPLLYSSSPLPSGLAILPGSVPSLGSPPGQIVGVPSTPGTTTITLTALNSAGSDTKVITITVAHVVITSTLAASGQVGLPFSFKVTASGNANVFNATGLPAGLGIAQDGTISGVPVNIPNQTGPLVFPILLSASNPYDTAQITMNITINPAPANSPVITSPLAATGVDGVPFNYQITATNNANGFNALGLPAGLTIDKTSGNIFGTPSGVGTFNVTLIATSTAITNGAGASILVLTINPAPPIITSPLTATAVAGQPFQYAFTASGTPAINFAAIGALPSGLTLNGNILSGTFPAGGTFTATIQASNAANPPDTEVLVITVSEAPAITSALAATAQVGVPFSYTITASGTVPIAYAASPLPPGLTLTGNTISGTPTQSTPTFNVTLTATNAIGVDTQTLVLTISPPAPPPVPTVTSALNVSATQGVPFIYQITAGPGVATQFDASALPDGLVVNAVSGLISGTPVVAGTFSALLTVTIPHGPATATLTFIVGSGTPTITSLSASGEVGSAFNLVLTASGALPLTFGASGLPPGLVLSNGVISGVPTLAGLYPVTLTAQNSFGSTGDTLLISIAPQPDDLDKDGFPNELEIALGTNPLLQSSTPFNGKQPLLSRALNVTNALIRLSFNSANHDSITAKGTFTGATQFSPSNQNVTVVVGGIVKKFTLDSKGNGGTGGSDKFSARLTGKPNAVTGDVNGIYTLKLSNGNFSQTLKTIGLTGTGDLTSVSRTVRFFVLFPDSLYLFDSSKVLSYTARTGRTGVARQVSPYSVR